MPTMVALTTVHEQFASNEDTVQVRFTNGLTLNVVWEEVVEMITTGTWVLSEIAKVSFNSENRMIPLAPAEMGDCPTRETLCALSEDYADNNNTVAFWFLQDISTNAIKGVIRHTDMMNLS